MEISRRDLLRAAVGTAASVMLPAQAYSQSSSTEDVIRIALITDLHHDLMHDGMKRMTDFLAGAKAIKADCLIQLGDFAYPNIKNQDVIAPFNAENGLHVIGNHDLDSGHTKEQCGEFWGIPGNYYAHDVRGVRILVLDGNEAGSPNHNGGYKAYVGKEQQAWLEGQLKSFAGPFVIVSHQPLAGAQAIDNATELQEILARYSSKILISLNGHSHLDLLLRVKGVSYLHVNSASYQWVGGSNKHNSFSESIHAAHPWIGHTCPYRDSVFGAISLNIKTGNILVHGTSSEWVGPTPAELGVDLDPSLNNGEEIAPQIRERVIERVAELRPPTSSWRLR
jgi:Icc protein